MKIYISCASISHKTTDDREDANFGKKVVCGNLCKIGISDKAQEDADTIIWAHNNPDGEQWLSKENDKAQEWYKAILVRLKDYPSSGSLFDIMFEDAVAIAENCINS